MELIFLEVVHQALYSGKVWGNRFFLFCIRLVGPYRKPFLNTLCQRIEITSVQESKLDNLLTKFWEISKIPEESDKNDDIITDFQKTIRFNEATGRYNVRLPWKQNKQDLPTNFILSKRRLNSLLNSLNKKDPGLIE